MDEAKADREAQKYSEALAKHVWYYHNALKYDKALSGVRTSFALNEWARLGEVYPPAIKELKSIRDDLEKGIREGKAERGMFEDFMDFKSINRTLDEEDRTKELFFWLDDHNPTVAKKVFDIAEPALIKAKAFRLCGKYLEPDSRYSMLVRLHQMNVQMAAKTTAGPAASPMNDFTEKSFSNGTATLVALLVLNNRKEEAAEIADKALKEMDTPSFRRMLDSAREGIVPPPWP